MIDCPSCHTLNPDGERSCLACGAALMGTARCPAGHPVDPAWKSCPYCDRLQSAAPGATRSDGVRAEAPSVARQTRLEPEAPRAGRATLLQGPPAATVSLSAAGEPAQPPVRRLLGVLAAPDFGPGGSVFAVRDGRNTLGADRSNEITLTGDSEVSSEHAVILHRNGAFHLTDRLSTNGTWVNGREVPANGTLALRDRDRIRCGRTELVFLVIEPTEGTPCP